MLALPTVLIADDNSSVRTVLGQALGRAGYQVQFSSDTTMVLHWAEEGEGDLVIIDVTRPEASDLTLIKRIRTIRPDLPVIAMGANQVVKAALQAAQCSIFDYLVKPFDLDTVLDAVRRALSGGDVPSDHGAVASDNDIDNILVGQSAAIQNIRNIIARLKVSDLPVMITGENGTGKAFLARILHDSGVRGQKPFIEVSKASLAASEPGNDYFKLAANGTLFINEISEISPEFQLQLLHFLQDNEGRVTGVSSESGGPVRVITTSRCDLREAVRAGLLREDLYYRLNVIPVHLPPLRERPDDIALLVSHFFKRLQTDNSVQIMPDTAALEQFQKWCWPGNVRELENTLRRIVTLYPHEVISADRVDQVLSEAQKEADGSGRVFSSDAGSFSDVISRYILHYLDTEREGMPVHDLYARVIAEVEKPLIQMTLAETRGNQIKAATILGLNRNTLRKKIRELDIPVVRYPT